MNTRKATTTKKKKKKVTKKKLPNLTKRKKTLDTLFSKWLRMSNADEEGNCTCISCGQVKHWKKMQCGHYCSRRHEITRWDTMNCHVQDARCNIFYEGNRIWYRRALVEKYGEDRVIALEDKSLEPSKFTRDDIERMIRHYTGEVKRLEKELESKGIFEES